MGWSTTLQLTFVFVGFVAFTFVLLRLTFDITTRQQMTMLAPPAMTIIGVIAGFIFVRFKLHDFFVWYMLFFAIIFFAWRRKSGLEEARLRLEREAPGIGEAGDEVLKEYRLTRQLLSLGLLVYGLAFVASTYYLILK